MEWVEANRAYLATEIARVHATLSGEAAETASWTGPDEPAIVVLAKLFDLSSFERDIILMCAGASLDPESAIRPTFARALATLRDDHLDASAPRRPLRWYRLVTLGSGETVLQAPLALDERVLYFLLGIDSTDERLFALEPAPLAEVALAPTHELFARRIARMLDESHASVAIQVHGRDASTRLAICEAAARAHGTRCLRVRGGALARMPLAAGQLARCIEREVLLTGVVPVIELDALDDLEANRAACDLVEAARTSLLVAGAQPLPLARRSIAMEVPAIETDERISVWQRALGPATTQRLGTSLDRLAHQFRLEPGELPSLALAADSAADDDLLETLWNHCRERVRPRIDNLASRIAPVATWSDLVVQPALKDTLHEIVIHLVHSYRVHEQLGYARGESRGQAITALFHGPSGTGKTLAAEVIAREAKLDLYRIDLSQVVDKYVGQTEKHLGRIFDAAERGTSILLFDEADALFGKRGEIQRATDRWANLEVSYLLQRMETYQGLAILTTNTRDALDNAFLRRIRFVARFGFPDVTQRVELWRRAFPKDAPTDGLEPSKLACLNLTGANIKSVAMRAAFYAAHDATPVTMVHVLRAARGEFAKLDMPFPEADVRSWGAPRS